MEHGSKNTYFVLHPVSHSEGSFLVNGSFSHLVAVKSLQFVLWDVKVNSFRLFHLVSWFRRSESCKHIFESLCGKLYKLNNFTMF
jgi:hypothetical protein